jgi:hypothetical protein
MEGDIGMGLRQPAQYYGTTIFDQYQPQSFSFAFVPLRSFANNQIPQLDTIVTMLQGHRLDAGEIQPWHLPVVLASILSGGGPMLSPSQLLPNLVYGGSVLVDAHKLGFADYVAHSDLIPFEESPIRGKSLMSIAGSAGVTIGLIAAGNNPIVILTVPLGILLCTAAAALGPELGKNLPKLMGLTR